MAKAKKNIETGMETAVNLSEKTAKTTLNSTVQLVEVTEDYIQNVYKAGYDANVDALKVAKGYWDAATEIRKDWVKLAHETGESVIDATANFELPTQKDVTKFGESVYTTVTDTVGRFIPQVK